MTSLKLTLPARADRWLIEFTPRRLSVAVSKNRWSSLESSEKCRGEDEEPKGDTVEDEGRGDRK